MSVRVSLESSVWSDARYDVLARLAGIDRFSAVGRMASIWATATDRETDKLDAAYVAVVFGVDDDTAREFLSRSELGDVLPDGRIRIRGCKGRTDWLAKARRSSKKGGAANKARWQARTEPPGYPGGEPKGEPNDSALTPSLTLTLTEEDPPNPQGGKREPPTGRQQPEPSETEAVVRVLDRLSELAGRRYSPETEQHAKRVLRLLRKGHTEAELLRVVEHKARQWGADPKMQYCLRPSTLFGPEKFAEYLPEAEARANGCTAPPGDDISPIERERLAGGFIPREHARMERCP